MIPFFWKYCFLLTLLLVALTVTTFSQEDSVRFTSFTKGRSLVAMGGSISSSVDNRVGQHTGSSHILSNYNINARLAKVVSRNFALGFSFTTEKYSTQQLIKIDTEVLLLGPWAAYYFTNGQPGGIFLQSAIYYVNYYENSTFLAISPPITESATGKGFAGSIGFGYTYVAFDRIGLEVSMVYNQARIYGEVVDNSFNTTRKNTFNRVDILFRFGFTVLFDKLKDE